MRMQEELTGPGNTVVDFYNQINLLYGSITEFCSPQTCPEMKATDEYAKQTNPPPVTITLCRIANPSDLFFF